MRTSNQLTKEYSCANNNGTAVTTRSNHIVLAQCQKEVLKMALWGEIPKEFDSIKSALQSSIFDHDVVFENRHQEEDLTNQYANRILRYTSWEQRELIFPEKEETGEEEERDANLLLPNEAGELTNTNVSVFGEEIKVLPDYITRNGNVTTIGKIKTGRTPAKSEEDSRLPEVYAYGLLGKKLYPNDRIEVEIVHLGDVNAGIEKVLARANMPFIPDESSAKAAIRAAFASGTYKSKINKIPFTPELEREFEAAHREELANNEIEVNENCASCPRYNVCNYTIPPVMQDIDIETQSAQAVINTNGIRLTDEQQQAVDYRHGTVRINAGAGAGKTLVVSWRVKEMLKEGIDPSKILLITFTNAGAEEMKARVKGYCAAEGVEYDNDKLVMTTFNAFCQRIIDDHYEELGFSRPPRIIPEEIRSDRINTIISRYPKISSLNYVSQGEFDKSRALPAIKNYFRVIKERGYTRTNNPWEDSDFAVTKRKVYDEDLKNYVNLTEAEKDILFQMYDDFDRTIKGENRIEYPDQMNLVKQLLTMNPRLFDEIGISHIIVDEFQDTDYPQIELLQKMKDASSFESLMCVGDDSQSIYAFRHTSPEYIINFGKYLGDGNDEIGYRFDNINLVENHRSTANIIDFANKINALNENRVDKDLIATKDYSDNSVNVHGYYSKKQEYKDTARMIKEDIDRGIAERAELKQKFDNGEITQEQYNDAVSKTVFPHNIAFLAYTKKELQLLGAELTNLGISSIMMVDLPYLDNSNCAAAQTFFDSYTYKTTQGAMDYINAKGHGSLMASTPEQIQEQVNEFMNTLDGQETTRDGFIEYVKALDPDGKDECLQKFIEEKLEPCENMDELKDLFRAMKLYGKDSTFKRQGKYENAVCLSTIHSAKGLEWHTVYYSADTLDEERFHKTFSQSKYIGRKEELNRMHFVAASRAKEKCVCVGRYVLNDSMQSGMPVNAALKAAFSFIDKPMNFQSSMVLQVKAQERREAKEESERTPRHTVSRVRQLTPEEQAEYRRLVAGARQMTIEDFGLEATEPSR